MHKRKIKRKIKRKTKKVAWNIARYKLNNMIGENAAGKTLKISKVLLSTLSLNLAVACLLSIVVYIFVF